MLNQKRKNEILSMVGTATIDQIIDLVAREAYAKGDEDRKIIYSRRFMHKAKQIKDSQPKNTRNKFNDNAIGYLVDVVLLIQSEKQHATEESC